MNRLSVSMIALLLLIGLNMAMCDGATKPNVILIIADDHGYPDYGFMGSQHARTPNLDKIASESLLYTRGYVMPVCSPSLACLLTGRFPHDHGLTGNDLADPKQRASRQPLAEQLLQNPLILPRAVSEAGYLTYQAGKLWNVTYSEVGFTDGMTNTAGRHGDAGLKIGREGMKPILEFMDSAREQDKPFFIWYAPMMPHDPHNAPERLLSKYRGRGPTAAAEAYFAMVEWFDQTCGELDRYLHENQLTDNTVILYLADNGWDAANGRQGKRAKLSPYELGVRTPMFVRWPAAVTPRRDDETLASIVDIAPSILKITGAQSSEDLPGLNLLDLDAMVARQSIFLESFTHDIADLKQPGKSLTARVIIHGWSKLLVPGIAAPTMTAAARPDGIELFDLSSDPQETNNLVAKDSAEVERLTKLLDAWWKP
jgi:uncharacterized sulfatase